METFPSTPADSFIPILQTFPSTALKREAESLDKLKLASDEYRGKRLDVGYAPFDHINHKAKVVIVGITPGRQQMTNALVECHRQLSLGASTARALEAAKVHASFSGPMRSNLVAMLDYIGVADLLGVPSSAELWGKHTELAHFTSALRYPVFVDGANYSGAPSMLRTPFLQEQLQTWFGEEMRRLPDALFVPLGPKVGEAIADVASRLGIPDEQILTGLPHPSGASGERIAYFLGRKPRELLSKKTNADRLDVARETLIAKIRKLRR